LRRAIARRRHLGLDAKRAETAAVCAPRQIGQAVRVLVGMLSDVHGNRVALDAVIADGVSKGVGAWWVLGDLVAIGPDPVSTLERLTDLPGVRFVRGNTDRYVVTGDRPSPHVEDVERDPSLRPLFDVVESSFAWTREAVEPGGWLTWLAELPTEQRAVLNDGTRLLGIHASPGSDDGDGITPAIPEAGLREMLADVRADVICAGHTHEPTDRRIGGQRAVNLGSVSNPITSDLRATYVIVNDDRHGHRLTHQRVDYDHDAVLERVRRSSHPAAQFIAEFQQGKQVRYPAERPGAPTFPD
jgi:predicted phosphodiesterase